MKKLFLIGLWLLSVTVSKAQIGLQQIRVETYYISDSADAMTSKGGLLPVGSVTYRIYADLLPQFRFQAVYGVPGHELRLTTTTFFFNNETMGSTTPNDIAAAELKNNTVMLDSWLSVGAGSAGNYGVLKSDDNGIETIQNAEFPLVLQSENPQAGIPIKKQDGLIKGPIQSVVSFFGIEKEIQIFGNTNENVKGQVFTTTNGSWASFGGSVGPDSTNKVLIAQLTTNGELSFKLNIQLGTPDGGVQNFVAENPVGNEIRLSSLSYPEIQNDPEVKNLRKRKKETANEKL